MVRRTHLSPCSDDLPTLAVPHCTGSLPSKKSNCVPFMQSASRKSFKIPTQKCFETS
ncbi:unnamed protein product, partial [Nesidiocoris tenuis]